MVKGDLIPTCVGLFSPFFPIKLNCEHGVMYVEAITSLDFLPYSNSNGHKYILEYVLILYAKMMVGKEMYQFS